MPMLSRAHVACSVLVIVIIVIAALALADGWISLAEARGGRGRGGGGHGGGGALWLPLLVLIGGGFGVVAVVDYFKNLKRPRAPSVNPVTVKKDDPRYFDLRQLPTPHPGQTPTEARFEQIDVIVRSGALLPKVRRRRRSQRRRRSPSRVPLKI